MLGLRGSSAVGNYVRIEYLMYPLYRRILGHLMPRPQEGRTRKLSAGAPNASVCSLDSLSESTDSLTHCIGLTDQRGGAVSDCVEVSSRWLEA